MVSSFIVAFVCSMAVEVEVIVFVDVVLRFVVKAVERSAVVEVVSLFTTVLKQST